MKLFLLLTLLPFLCEAKFSKPELMARFMYSGAWNAPDNLWCFSGEPAVLNNKIFLNCLDSQGSLMAQWSDGNFETIARAEMDQVFSKPINSFHKMNWYEFNEFKAIRSYMVSDLIQKIDISNLGPIDVAKDSFLPLTVDSFFFRLKSEGPELLMWENNKVSPFFRPGSAFLFSPQVGPKGEIALKARDLNFDENSPDRIWHYNGNWEVVLEDQSANPLSPWKSVRNQMSVEGNRVLVIANDGMQDSLILIEGAEMEIIARTGKDLAKFDYFGPKMKNGVIIVRGVDFEGRKAIYVKDETSFRKLLCQGDIVKTDLGDGMVDYENQDAIFYGAPSLDEDGSVYLQATLVGAERSKTLLGVGLIKLTHE